jgi:hypothetical protein
VSFFGCPYKRKDEGTIVNVLDVLKRVMKNQKVEEDPQLRERGVGGCGKGQA